MGHPAFNPSLRIVDLAADEVDVIPQYLNQINLHIISNLPTQVSIFHQQAEKILQQGLQNESIARTVISDKDAPGLLSRGQADDPRLGF
jgi:hypothetical protein